MKRLFLIFSMILLVNTTIDSKNFNRIFVPSKNISLPSENLTYDNNWSPLPTTSSKEVTDVSKTDTDNQDTDDDSMAAASSISSSSTKTQQPTDSTKKIVIINNQKSSTNVFGSEVNNLYLYLNNGNNSKLLTTVKAQDVTVTQIATTQTGDLFISPTKISPYPSSGGSTRFLQPLDIGTDGNADTSEIDIFSVQPNPISSDTYLFNRVSTENRTLVINNTSSIDVLVRINVTVSSANHNSNKNAYIFYLVPAQTIATIRTPDLIPRSSSNKNSITYNTQDFTFAIKAHQSKNEIQTLKKAGKNGAVFVDSGTPISDELTVNSITNTAIYSIQENSSSFSANLQLSITSATNF